jgi:CYTH domain-containing protein
LTEKYFTLTDDAWRIAVGIDIRKNQGIISTMKTDLLLAEQNEKEFT